MKSYLNQMQTMEMGSAEAALTQMSAVPTASSSSYFLQLDPSGHIDILESSLVLAKPDIENETVYEIQLDPFMVDERNVEVVNLQNFQNVAFQPEFFDEHNNLITTSYNPQTIQYQIDDINFNQMIMNNGITTILPTPPPVVLPTTQEAQQMVEVETVPDFTVETEIASDMVANQIAEVKDEPAPLELFPTEVPSETVTEKMDCVEKEEDVDSVTKSEGLPSLPDEKVEVESKEKEPPKKKWVFPEKLWDFNEEPAMPPYKEIYPSTKPLSTETLLASQVVTLSDNEEDDTMEEDESVGKIQLKSEFLYDGIDPDDELYISYLSRPDECKTALCILCYEWFNTTSDLDSHLKAVHQNRMVLYGCKRCGKQFWSRFLRQRHEKLHRYDLKGPIQRYFPQNRPFDHHESKHFLKRLRPAPFTKQYKEKIRLIHSQIKSSEFECIECSKEFRTEEEYREHYDENHALQTCLHCREVFDNAKCLRKHEQNAHGVYQVKKNYPGGAWKLWESSWDCDELKEKDDQLVNIYLYHNYSKRMKDEKGSGKDAKVAGDQFFMFGCEEVTVTANEYEASKKILNKKKPTEKAQSPSKAGSKSTTCLSSPDVTKSRKNDPKLTPVPDDDYGKIEFVDLKTDHPKGSKKLNLPFKCQTCKTSFNTDADLQRHIKSHSIRAMAYMCQYCGRGFATHSNRKEHERIHTGDKPYVCPICTRAFVQISNLKKHIQTHKDKNNLQCSTCNKQFVKESSLILHQRAHSQDRKFRCHICDRAYNYASLLKRHMRIHTGENPYSCDDCGMQFHELVSLHYHRKKVHTGERPHRCEECGRAFILSSDLKKHLKIHLRNGNSVKPANANAKGSNSKSTVSPKNVPQQSTAKVLENVPGAKELTSPIIGMNKKDQSIYMSTKSDVSGEEMCRADGGQSLSDGSHILVISEADLLNSAGNVKDEEVIAKETKENCVQLSEKNHIGPAS